MRKSFLLFIIIIFTLLIGLILYSFSKSPTYYTGIATIVDYKGYKASYAKIDGVNDSKNDNIVIYSTLFKVGDKINVEYYRENGNYYISKLGAEIKSEKEKKDMVEVINNDRKLAEYKSTNKCDIYRNGILSNCSQLGIIPIKITNQLYDDLISPEDYIKYLSHPDLGTFKDEQVTLILLDNYEIIKVQNIYNDNVEEIVYELNERSLSFISLGYGIYVIEIKFENGDIVNYVFI